MQLSDIMVWLVISSQVGIFTLGYILGFVGGKRHAFKLAKVQNFSDLK